MARFRVGAKARAKHSLRGHAHETSIQTFRGGFIPSQICTKKRCTPMSMFTNYLQAQRWAHLRALHAVMGYTELPKKAARNSIANVPTQHAFQTLKLLVEKCPNLTICGIYTEYLWGNLWRVVKIYVKIYCIIVFSPQAHTVCISKSNDPFHGLSMQDGPL
jgi:hypothetical protein